MKEVKILKKPAFWLFLSLVLIITVFFQWPDKQLHVVFCDVGQGDAILVVRGSFQMLIDGGPDQQVLDCLGRHLPFWDQKIEVLMATHPDDDHLTGLIEVIERYQVNQFLLNSVGKDSALFETFQKAVLSEGAGVYFPQKGDRIKLGFLKMVFLWPERQERVLGATTVAKEANETSLVVQVSFGDFDLLLPGDVSSKIEVQLDLEDVEILKAPHHGSKYSTGEELLEQTKPEMVVISVGKNYFGHPTKEVLERVMQKEIDLLRTDQSGEIEIVTDGQKWGIKD